MTIEENIPLRTLTTFHLGGPARFFARASSVEEIRDALAFAQEKNLRTFILGGGSNVLISDAGFDGLVIKIEIKGLVQEGDLLIAGAGEEWDALVQHAVRENRWGIENLSGIPGSVGASPVQNIGAYGMELQHTLEYVEALDVEKGEVRRFSSDECGFSYRTSVFKQRPGGFVLLKVALRLQRDGIPNLSYRDLAQASLGQRPTLQEIRDTVLAIRAKKFPDIRLEGTAGSFFLNPVVSPDIAQMLRTAYPELPQFPAAGGIKLSLAWLLDHALQAKGMRVGGARCFERQPLVIVAGKEASASDVKALAEKISSLVTMNFNIALEPEVRMV